MISFMITSSGKYIFIWLSALPCWDFNKKQFYTPGKQQLSWKINSSELEMYLCNIKCPHWRRQMQVCHGGISAEMCSELIAEHYIWDISYIPLWLSLLRNEDMSSLPRTTLSKASKKCCSSTGVKCVGMRCWMWALLSVKWYSALVPSFLATSKFIWETTGEGI